MTKRCSRCGEEKEIDNFGKRIKSKDGYNAKCKKCYREYQTAFYQKTKNDEKRKQKQKEYLQNPQVKKRINEYNKKYQKKYRLANKEKRRKYSSEYQSKNKNDRNICRKKWRQRKEVKNKNRKKYQFKKMNDVNYRVRMILSGRIRKVVQLQNSQKAYKTKELIGCSIDFLKQHLQETAIKNGYKDFDINSYSGKDYHIDHIKPCSSFDLTKPEEQLKCFNWSNLQILTAEENLEKGIK